MWKETVEQLCELIHKTCAVIQYTYIILLM